MARAVFLDRDGVINRKPAEGRYLTCWEEMQFLPGAVEAIALLNRAGFCVIVVTNQRCVAKGLMTAADLEAMHRRMSDVLARAGATIDGVYYCPHEMQPPCKCRKPEPGLLLRAARSRGIELPASWMIGDSDTDVEAGRNAGCKTARLLETRETIAVTESHDATPGYADIVAPSLLDAIRQILQWEKVAPGSCTTASP
jgi:D-glycero-D-manno-heptose 1,7-bisphosphate phosphatase